MLFFLETERGMEVAHSVTGTTGDTKAPNTNINVETHFICFTCMDEVLYKLDGRKLQPVSVGSSSPDCLLRDAGLLYHPMTFTYNQQPQNSLGCQALCLFPGKCQH